MPSPLELSARLKWGAIFGGAVASLGIASMLYSLGLALGLSWIDPQDPGSLRPTGIFSGIWMLVVSLIALFVGGYVSARGAGALSRGFGALQGLVMWGLSVIAGAWLIGNLASAVARGGAAIGRTATSVVGGSVSSMSQRGGLAGLGVTSNDLLGPVNQRLRGSGKPEVTAQQLENATRDALQSSVRQGRLDRETLTQALAANTTLSRADAEQVAGDAEARFQAMQSNVTHSALAVAEDSSKAFWALFAALLLGMLAAIAGAVVAGDRGQRSTSQMGTRHAPAAGGHSEVYP